MKKILYFGLCICAILAMCFCVPIFSSVNAEETETTISIDSATKFDDLFKSDIASGQKFVLTDDIVLTSAVTTFENRNIQDIEFDGNGHTIVTSYPLFHTISNSAVVKNLNVIASKNFAHNMLSSTVSSFGLIACDVQGASVFNVSASCEIAPSTETTDSYGVLDLNFNGSAYIGGMFGQLRYGAVIQDCYARTSLKITQNDLTASSTVVGGFAGYVDNAKITNCYVVPVESTLISIADSDYLEYTVGGFIGQVGNNIQGCVNVFTGGILPIADSNSNKIVGKIFGEIGYITNAQSNLKISKCYSYNQSTILNLYGTKNEQTEIDVGTITASNLQSISTFYCDAQIDQKDVWDSNYEWDLSQTWCKKEVMPEVSLDDLSAVEKWGKTNYNYPVLQIFESFTITISEDSNSLGVSVTLVDDEDNLLTDTKFQYGTQIFIKIEITENYLPYKVIDSLKFNNQTYLQFSDDSQLKSVPITVSDETAGSYYASTKNISYYINVKSENVNKGTVRYKNSTQNLSENQNSRIEYGSSLSFTAVESTVSYAFEKWVWLDENGNEAGDAILGTTLTADSHLAQKSMTVAFGNTTTSTDSLICLYLTQTEDVLVANNNIPYKNVEGKIIFTLQAKFSTNIKELSVYVNAPSDDCQVFIGGTECDGVYDSGMYFSENVIVASYVKLKVELSDNYKFVGWSCEDYDINELIDKKYSDANATEIYVKIQDATLLYAQVSAIEQAKTDLTWLWITLGGLGGAGLITLIVVLAVRKKKTESFVRYY